MTAAKAKAESAQTHVQFVKAKMEADLEVLLYVQHEKEQAAVLAQAEVLEAAVGATEDCISSTSFSVSSHNSVESTRDYVETQTQLKKNMQNSNFSYNLSPEDINCNCSHSL